VTNPATSVTEASASQLPSFDSFRFFRPYSIDRTFLMPPTNVPVPGSAATIVVIILPHVIFPIGSLSQAPPHAIPAVTPMWIKICGITQVDDGVSVAKSGASAIGLNFFEGSRRFVSADRAVPIISAVRSITPDRPLDIVGVFVNSAIPEVAQIARQLSLTAVQFHGDESLASIAEFRRLMPKTHIIRAMRVSLERSELCLAELDRIQSEVGLSGCLLDAYVSGEFGGTGTKVDLRIARQYLTSPRPRLILAGGLTPDNVGDVILRAKPWGVDTASGVEASPGRKQPEKIAAFVASAAQADSQPGAGVLSSIPLTTAVTSRL